MRASDEQRERAQITNRESEEVDGRESRSLPWWPVIDNGELSQGEWRTVYIKIQTQDGFDSRNPVQHDVNHFLTSSIIHRSLFIQTLGSSSSAVINRASVHTTCSHQTRVAISIHIHTIAPCL